MKSKSCMFSIHQWEDPLCLRHKQTEKFNSKLILMQLIACSMSFNPKANTVQKFSS